MSVTKTAEHAFTDSGKFPKETMREILARRYGIDAVALSGPCEGQSIVECVVNQLESRWDRIKERYAGNIGKATKLAAKLAETYMKKDDTEKCVADLQGIGYSKEAASGVAGYLKAYAMDMANDMAVQKAADEVDAEPAVDAPGADIAPIDDAAPEGLDAAPSPADEAPADLPTDLPVEEPLGEGVAPATDLGAEGDTVTIELPAELAQELADAIAPQVAPVGEGEAMLDEGIGGEPKMEEPSLDIEVVDLDKGDGGMPEMIEEVKDEIVPGEPSGMGDKQVVEGEPAEAMAGEQCACAKQCACGAEQPKEVCPVCGKEKKPEAPKAEALKAEPKKEEPKSEPKAEKKDEKPEAKDEKPEAKEASSKAMTKTAEEIRKIGPEMSLNSTDQTPGGKPLGAAKEKEVPAPKPVADGNLETEGFSAGDKKFQDGKTMGHEQKFDAKQLDKGSVTGGEKSIMGKDEHYPEGKAKVPAGSAPIGGETLTGGDVATKGTIIATITPKGVLVESNGKKYLAAGEIKPEMVAKIQEGLGKVEAADGKKFAQAALKLITAKKDEGINKIDTAKLEATKFTNDGDKKPDEGGAITGKGKAAPKDEGVNKIDTAKLEAEKFTNDGEKKAEGEKKASSEKEVKTAKPVEAPKALEDGNVKPEGYTAGDSKFSDGKTMGHEQKFDPKKVDKGDVSKGAASEMGKDEKFPEGKADVPNGGGVMGHEIFKGDNLSTKGTTIADNQSQKREAELQAKINEAKVEKQRILAASVYVADIFRNGEISEAEYSKELEKAAAMSVPEIQRLIASTKKARERVAAKAVQAEPKAEIRTAGLTVPIVIQQAGTEKSLKDRLVEQFKMTKDLDRISAMPERK